MNSDIYTYNSAIAPVCKICEILIEAYMWTAAVRGASFSDPLDGDVGILQSGVALLGPTYEAGSSIGSIS
jgi:hypothetical protein